MPPTPTAASVEDECLHGMDPEWCALCIHGLETSKVPTPTTATREAMYVKQSCNTCGDRIDIGDLVRKWTDGSWRCAEHE